MHFVTSSDPLLRFAVWAGAALLAASLVMLIAVVCLRLGLLARRAHERRVTSRWQALLAECALGDPAAVPSARANDAYLLLRLWNSYHEAVSGEATERLNRLARRAGLDRLAMRMLYGRGARLKLIAIATAGHLRNRDALPQLDQLVCSEVLPVALAAARALLKIDAQAALARLVPLFLSRVDWPLSRVDTMLREAGADIVTPFLAAAVDEAIAGSLPPEQTMRLLRLARVAHPDAVMPRLMSLLEKTDEPEILAAGLPLVCDPRGLALVRRCCTHPEWWVRTAATRALARIAAPEDRPLLVGLLNDAHWWVRYGAARALAALPFVGRDELQRLRTTLTDRYARDALRQAMAERGWA